MSEDDLAPAIRAKARAEAFLEAAHYVAGCARLERLYGETMTAHSLDRVAEALMSKAAQ